MSNLFKVLSIVFCAFFVSCSDILDEKDTQGRLYQTRAFFAQDFVLENGCLNFKDKVSYMNVLTTLNGKSKTELITWSTNNGFNSLLASYECYNSGEDDEKSTSVYEMADEAAATLFNENGLLVINDTIYKVINEYVYIIPGKDFDFLQDIDKINNSPASMKYQHTQYLQPVVLTRSSVSGGERSFMIQVSKKRREYAEFDVSKSYSKITGMAFANIKLKGRAQKKKMWWKLPFDDELVWGQVNCDGILINDRVAKPGAVSPLVRNQKETSVSIPLTADNVINSLKVHVIFTFCKNQVKGDETYVHEYINP